MPVLKAGNYTTWFKYGDSGWVERRPHGLRIEIQEDATVKVFVTGAEVTTWRLDQDHRIVWENEPNSSRGGVPEAATLKFDYATNSFSGFFRYRGEGPIDFRGEFEA
jgi:hypothetical protein